MSGKDTSVEVHIDWNRIRNEAKEKKLTAQKALDNAIIEDTDPFVPFREGTLSRSVTRASRVGEGEIVWDTPYARHMYYGVHYLTGTPFVYNRFSHPLATERWFEHAKSAYLEKWRREVEEIFRR